MELSGFHCPELRLNYIYIWWVSRKFCTDTHTSSTAYMRLTVLIVCEADNQNYRIWTYLCFSWWDAGGWINQLTVDWQITKWICTKYNKIRDTVYHHQFPIWTLQCFALWPNSCLTNDSSTFKYQQVINIVAWYAKCKHLLWEAHHQKEEFLFCHC